MYIQPNTDIRLLTNVPLDNTYEHTIWFKNYYDSNPSVKDNSIALLFQANYFAGKTKWTLPKNTYQRVKDGVMRVSKSADACYDCNYLMFKNTNHSNKWFYGFITSVRYINELTCEIAYEIDVMQTYMYDYELGQSYIDREHTKYDEVGHNTYPENLEQGEYMITNTPDFRFLGTVDNYSTEDITNARVIFQCSFTYNKSTGQCSDVEPQIINGVLSCLTYIPFELKFRTSAEYNRSIEAIQEFLQNTYDQDKWEGIINCYIIPNYYPASEESLETIAPLGAVNNIPKQQSIIGDNYQPRNKKLLTYPFNILHLYCDSGSADFRYEFFPEDDEYCYFDIETTVTPSPVMNCHPKNYSNYGTHAGANQEFTLVIDNYPQIAWTGDVFKIWYAQNGVQTAISTGASILDAIGSTIGIAMGAKSAGLTAANAVGSQASMPSWYSLSTQQSLSHSTMQSAYENTAMQYATTHSGGLIGSIENIASNFARIHELKNRPATVNGKQSSLSDYAFGKKHFFWANLSIRNEYAEKIDSFFDKYGYKTMELKKPNIDNRKYWWYTKTLGCEIHNSKMPNDDLKFIASIYDKGITFWKWNENEGVDIANYDKNNIIINA